MLAAGRSLPAATAARAAAVSRRPGSPPTAVILRALAGTGGPRKGASPAPPLRGPGTARAAVPPATAGTGAAEAPPVAAGGGGGGAGGAAGGAGGGGGGGGGGWGLKGVLFAGAAVGTVVYATAPEWEDLAKKAGFDNVRLPDGWNGQGREPWTQPKLMTLDDLRNFDVLGWATKKQQSASTPTSGGQTPTTASSDDNRTATTGLPNEGASEGSSDSSLEYSGHDSSRQQAVAVDDARAAALADITEEVESAAQSAKSAVSELDPSAAVESAVDVAESVVGSGSQSSASKFNTDSAEEPDSAVIPSDSATPAAGQSVISEASAEAKIEAVAASGTDAEAPAVAEVKAAVEATTMLEDGNGVEGKKWRIRNEALSKVAEEMEVAAAGLKREVEQSMLKDLKTLDEDALRFRVAQLAAEMQERMKWEALRLMEGVKRAEAEISRKYANLLTEQKETQEAEKRRELTTQEEALTEVFVKQYSDQLRQNLEQQATDFAEALHNKVLAGNDVLRAELAAQHADEISVLKEQMATEAEGRIAELQYLREQTERIGRGLDAAHEAEKESEDVHRVAYAALALAERFASSKPIKRELDNLRSLAAGDQLLEAAASSIPEAAAKKGIPTLEQLRARFGLVKSECRRAALVPAQAGDGLGGQIMASVLSKITFAPKGMVEGSAPEEVLARADYLLEVGELSSAVGELEKLEGLPKETVRDWLKDARTRLTADEALKVIRCHASLLSAKHLGKA